LKARIRSKIDRSPTDPRRLRGARRGGETGPAIEALREFAMSSGALEFELDGRTLSFATVDDFAFSSSGRTRVATS